ncbi:MAG: glycosyltransferase [Proteobacteria bacterium]|nr:glycosyltransferase [Pseudomonadota bacterium]
MDIVLLSTVVCLCITAFFFIMNILNVLYVKKVERYPDSEECQRVSVIVPARNEERNIRTCVGSLLGQDYSSFEVIVVNDHSDDSTAKILSELQEKYPHLRVLDCEALPPGWTGKNWACHEGYRQAQGELLVFTDADTQHAPHFLRKAVAALLHEQADLLTVIPRFATISLAEKAIMPVLIWLAYSVFPFALMNRNRLRIVSYSNGAFLMFRRDAYRKIGGHAAIRDNVIDDLTLGVRIRRAGMRCVVVNGSAALQCRMYTSMQEIYSGFAKNLFRLFSNSLPTCIAVPLCALCWLFFCFIYIVPVCAAVFFILRLQGSLISPGTALVAGMSILCAFSSFFLVSTHFRYPRLMAFLYPINIFLLFTIAMNSIIQTLRGQTEWKGRSLHAELRK